MNILTLRLKKNERFEVYNYINNFKKFGFEWIQKDLGLKYEIKIDSSNSKKIKKKLTLIKETRNKIVLDETRIWNKKVKWKKNESGVDNSRLSFLIGYLYNEADMKRLLGFTHSYNFAGINFNKK